MTIPTEIFDGYWYGWMLAGVAFSLLLVGLMGRGPVRLFAPLFRLVALPFRPLVFLMRKARLLPKAAARTRGARNAAINAQTSMQHVLGEKTEIDLALSMPDDDAAADETSILQPYDYSEARKSIKVDGAYFRSISIRASYLPEALTSPMSEEIGDDYYNDAHKFFNEPLKLNVNEQALYEDVDGARVIELFRKFDRRCYYALNEMRKTINGNARRLMVMFSLILVAAAVAVFVLQIDPMAKIAICAGVLLVMIVWHSGGYQKQQQHSIRELRSFLTRYLGRISDRFREVTGYARGVTVGDETDSKRLAQTAMKWHKVMMWLPFRTFFIETFVRNLLYQVRRNAAYYLYLWIPAVAATAGVIACALSTRRYAIPDPHDAAGVATLAAFGVVALAYFYLINVKVISVELDQTDWLGFDNLNVSDAMDEVVGKYAEDVGFWKGRLDRG